MSAEKKSDKMRQELKPGERVILDQGSAYGGEVEVVYQTSGRLYTAVKFEDEQWQVMTYRLTKLTP